MTITKPIDNIHIFIGFDDLQPAAYKTCAYSIKRWTDNNVHIHPLHHRTLREQGLFNRAWEVTEKGTWVDKTDGLPFSTTFSHARFLVPKYFEHLGLYNDYANKWAIFVDSDFIALDDVRSLVDDAYATKAPLSVVKHNYQGKGTVKMDAREQTNYNCKLWSSLMVFDMHLWNMDDEDLDVNRDTGRSLHTFDWYKPGLDAIGSLPERWNFIPDHSEKTCLYPSFIHFTEGTPLHRGYEDCKYGELFKQAYQGMLMETARRINDGLS